MSLSFPASPTNGQVYQGWTYSSSSGGWVPNFSSTLVASYNGRAGAVVPLTGDETKGNRVLITATDVVAPVTNVDFFAGFDGTYDFFELDIADLLSAVDSSTYPQLRCSADGSTFDAGAAAYGGGYLYWNSGAATVASGATAAGSVLQLGTSVGTVTAYSNRLHIKIHRSLVARNAIIWSAQLTNSAVNAAVYGAGLYGSGTAKGLRFFLAGSTNITRGSFRLYGIKK